MFSYHKGIKLEFDNNKIFRKAQILAHTTIIFKKSQGKLKRKVRPKRTYTI